VCDDVKLQVTKQCKIKFAITTNFFDKVELDVMPLDICGIDLGSSYLFDRKFVFYREENKYHLLKNGIEYIVRDHRIKTNVYLVSILIQVDIGGHPPFLTGSKQFSGKFDNLLFLAVFNFRGVWVL
jgi:hypothetical protein